MVHRHFFEHFLLIYSSLGFFVLANAYLSNVSSSHGSLPLGFRKEKINSFKIDNDMFWKDGEPIHLIGGDLHYFRVLPKYWEDRLLRAKALGLNTIQTYVPWNLHEPLPENWVFEGIADIESFLKLAQELGFLVMLSAGPYICAGK
ncbi:hypothetical protein HPP92_005236 [Vanilla planifolia]|uniref:beta-galactosidase n=1 Tax=Vanilla planifolia TaxID=51239 RepID=A0A835VD04_VANPL|nr:hypothetical protein HPP92_005236 [Vanilla planifolia]